MEKKTILLNEAPELGGNRSSISGLRGLGTPEVVLHRGPSKAGCVHAWSVLSVLPPCRGMPAKCRQTKKPLGTAGPSQPLE